jgi:AraC-like DNA-binding protein
MGFLPGIILILIEITFYVTLHSNPKYMTMKPQHPVDPKTIQPLQWQVLHLPVGLTVAFLTSSADALDVSLHVPAEKGFTLAFIQYKGEVHIRPGEGPQGIEHPASPGLSLLSQTGRPMQFLAGKPVAFSALALFIPGVWARLFFDGNQQFRKIEQLLEEGPNIITCRLGRRQMSLFTSILSAGHTREPNLLTIQNHALALLEYFLGNRHRSLLGANPASDIDNEDDLTLIREVESYISEFYCSDTFTVDSILKKTYTSYHRLNFLFKSIHGMTISEYIRNKRIEKSKEMIADNAKSISQIAYEIGYSSISNYILAFKKVYQITPGKYKKQMDNLV